MPVTIIVGTQWGDEGKGKIVDLLSQNADVVARFQGGANAGHTVVVNKKQTILNLIPSGILHPNCTCLMGSGMVIDPVKLLNEIEYLEREGVTTRGRLFISQQAHLILPYHKIVDEIIEQTRGKDPIGTTKRGIGPAYTDKYRRTGIRMVDILDRELFIDKLRTAIVINNHFILENGGDAFLMDNEEISDYHSNLFERIGSMITDVSVLVNDAATNGKNILLEGAQGTLLDIDWGTYPYVTSSNPTAGGAITGLGIGPTLVDKVIGVIKAYTTRVGEGPFPTEFDEVLSERMRQAGSEFGATTGRARRCGWFDAVIARYAARINGISSWALTKLDVLSNCEEIKIAVEYQYKGKRYSNFPAETNILKNATPIYETLPGWCEDISKIRKLEELPTNARSYVERIEDLTNTKVGLISIGSDRDDTIFR